MHLSTANYLFSIFSLLNAIPTTLASPTLRSSSTITYRTSSDRACHHGTYSSLSKCLVNCGSGPSIGNCIKIASIFVHDSPPYDCTCPRDNNNKIAVNNDESQTQISSQPRLQIPRLPAQDSKKLSTQDLRFQSKVAQQQHQDRFVEKASQKPKPVPETPCKRGYHKTMDMCMANCGTRSGNCISVDGGNAVACQCTLGEL